MNLRQWSEANQHTTTFRKTVSSVATLAGDWVDYGYFAGNPPANFYASTPLVAAEVELIRGATLPQVDQWLRNITVMSSASSSTSTTNANQTVQAIDYLMYYPFVDTDAVGEQQDMMNSFSLPRYGCGMVMAVSQSASSSVGTFTITYTNQDGVGGRVSQATNTNIVAGGGIILTVNPFIGLQGNDYGVKSIESVNFSVAGGGLMALVIVQPLKTTVVTQECRRTTTGNLESYGAATQQESLIHTQPVMIKSGARFGFIGLGAIGTLASSALVASINTVWGN
jgi:hypothetical protein